MNTILSERNKAVIFLITAAVLWSFGGLFIKLVSWNPLAIAGMRSAIASVLIFMVLRRPKITWSFPQTGGAVAYAATVILYVAANKLTTAANAILLQYTAPIYVALFGAWFLNERTRVFDWIVIFFVIAGMTLFFFDDLAVGGVLGNVLAILSGISFACVVLFMRKQKNESPLESVFLGNVLTALICMPFMFGSIPDLNSWAVLIFLGIFQLGLSYILYSAAIKHVTALEAILIPVLEPILNPIWVFMAIGEMPGPWSLVGGFIVVVSVTARCVLTTLKKESADMEAENCLQ